MRCFCSGVIRSIKWLPRIGKLLKVGGSLCQCIGASVQERYSIAVAPDFDSILIDTFSHRFGGLCQAGLPVLRPSTDGALYSRPVFLLLRGQLQCSLDQINPQIRQAIRGRYA